MTTRHARKQPTASGVEGVLVALPTGAIADLCRRYHVRELAVFGSALRADLRPDSDLDLLVEFEPDAEIGMLALSRMRRELEELVGREVDLVPRRGLKPAVRAQVEQSARVLYAA